MNKTYEKIMRCRDEVYQRSGRFEPHIALVLGSGLGNLDSLMDVVSEVPYGDVPGFPVSSVMGHAGKYLFGYLDSVPVVCMQGRVHLYEGYSPEDVVLPVRVMGMLGASKLLLTNAAGSLNPAMETPTMMLITDHILLFSHNPLIGENIDDFGIRFPDMSHVYDPELCNILRQSARKQSLKLSEGVYVQLTGPSYETPAEVRMLGLLGGSAVGMSTACEAVAARHMGMRVCGVSCISNKGAGISTEPLTHEEVFTAGQFMSSSMTALVRGAIQELDKA